MKYKLDWLESAEDQLAAVWLKAVDHAAVTAAAQRIEANLELRPLLIGESRQSSVSRVVYDRPIWLIYDIIQDDLRVVVIADGDCE